MTIYTRKSRAKRHLALIFCLILMGCATTPFGQAEQAGFRKQVVQAGLFKLMTLSRQGQGNVPWHIYIEGDGRAWRSRTQPSGDPTPYNPVGLRLAMQDEWPNVLYLARPCQYTDDDRACDQRYWTTHRFSFEVVGAMNEAVDLLTPALSQKHLIGYSGGGAIAVLVAAQRADVVSLRTVAGNLDHKAFTQHHELTPLYGSLNPILFAPSLRHIKQEHFIGGKDKVIPPYIAHSFVMKQGKGAKAQIIEVPEASHSVGWEGLWLL